MLRIIEQHPELLVLHKPANVALFADRSGAPNLWDQLRADPRFGKPWQVHRLDKGTSGVLLVALSAPMQARLTRLFAAREVRKFYLAQVVGRFVSGATVTIDLPLCKGRKSRYRVAAPRATIELAGHTYHAQPDRDGVAATTRVRCLARSATHSLLLAQPLTGRTHQLRVHLAWTGFPIVGDTLYGQPAGAAQAHPRLQLQAHRLVVPGVGTFTAPADLTTNAPGAVLSS